MVKIRKKNKSPTKEVGETARIIEKGSKGEPDRVTCSLGAKIKFGSYNNREISLFYSCSSNVRESENNVQALSRVDKLVQAKIKKEIEIQSKSIKKI